jgi:acid phosphatase (class A)
MTALLAKGRRIFSCVFLPGCASTGQKMKVKEMKTNVIGIATLLFLSSPVFGQKTWSDRELIPARGHYKQLSALDPKPRAADMAIDKQKFFTDQASIDRRMSLKPIYLRNVAIKDFKLPDVPANSSEQTLAEINYLLALQRYRTAEEIRSSMYMADVYYNLRVMPGDSTYRRYRTNLFRIGRSIGSWFNPENLPITADFMAKVWQDASYFIWSFKFKYARVRPVVIDPRIKNLQETDWAAYPSGHASNSYINAFIYQELAPEFTDVFIKDAYDMAHSREILGVHYPSDSESARIFARQFVNMLFKNDEFRKDFENVKREWSARAKESLD